VCHHGRVAELSARERARLPASAFAYIDSTGKRKLPIHDAAHVRNALARFNRVVFEDDAARDRARTRLLRAAQKHGVAPIGFVRSELQPQRRFPTGPVTFMITDLESSTELLARLGEAYAPLLTQIRRLVRTSVRRAGGYEVDSRGDETFAVFGEGAAGVRAAVGLQRAMREAVWPEGADVRLRIGLHSGRPKLTETGGSGLRRGPWRPDHLDVGRTIGPRRRRHRRDHAQATRPVALPWHAEADRAVPGRLRGRLRLVPASALGDPC
jgi:class 3 adenylate cyclase